MAVSDNSPWVQPEGVPVAIQADINQAADEVEEMLRISREKIEVSLLPSACTLPNGECGFQMSCLPAEYGEASPDENLWHAHSIIEALFGG